MTERKVAVVTAAAGVGIGSAIAHKLAEDGMEVVITDAHERRCGEYAEKFSQECGREFISLPLDVTDPQAVEAIMAKTVEKFARLDILVNNAGFNKIEPIAEMSLETWHAPWLSHQMILSKSPRRPRKTNRWPQNGSAASVFSA